MKNVTLAAVLLALATAIPATAKADAWGCYDPKPGHPSDAERAAFIAEVSTLAVKAEHDYGVPAAAVAAMSMVESGYGWTRTALEANNLFGWKYVSASAAGGRTSYTLACQPPEDINNHYVVFHDRADAIDFVAHKLATLAAYKTDRDAYQMQVSQHGDVRAAIKAWVAGISDPYNWKPQEYTRTVIRIMNSPDAPSDTEASNNLYQLSDTAPTIAKSNLSPAVAMTPTTDKDGCQSPDLHYPRWEGFPVRYCPYNDVGITTHGYFLNPSPDKVTKWINTACADAAVQDVAQCIKWLRREVQKASSGKYFPVGGFIVEKAEDAGGVGQGPLCLLFRDGITIATDSWDTSAPINGKCGSGSEDQQPVKRAKNYARIASTSREEYYAAGGAEDVGHSGSGNKHWLDVIREMYQRAWNSDRNELISARAIAAKKSGHLK